MKQLKIRVWDKRLQKMIYFGGDISFNWEYAHLSIALSEGQNTDEILFISESSDWEEPMLFIGMKDKAGKEIYAGDIIWEGVYDQHSGEKIASVVDFQDYGYVLVSLSTWTDLEYAGGGYTRLAYAYPVKYEIIGNIYETS